MPWDVARYADRPKSKQADSGLRNQYPPLFAEPTLLSSEPRVVVDRHGSIILWYLPVLFTADRQVSGDLSARRWPLTDGSDNLQAKIWAAQGHLQTLLARNTPDKKSGSNWRVDPKYFKPKETCHLCPGSLNFSPGWFQQGHQVAEQKLFC